MSDRPIALTADVPIQGARALRWASDVFAACGMRKDDAHLVANQLVSDDLRGVLSHGLLRIPNYVDRLTGGAVDPTAQPSVLRTDGATALVDGNNAMGQVVGAYAMGVAIDLASRHGASSVAIRGSNHFGTCAHYALMAVDRGMIGIAATVSSGNIMAPWGSVEALLGNNPFAIAVPAGKHPPLVLDIAFSVAAGGKIQLAAEQGRQIPATWAIGEDGLPETDPSRALQNLLVRPVGDHKGYGLAFMVAVMCAVLPDAAVGRDVLNSRQETTRPQNTGHWLQVIDVARYAGTNEFRARVDQVIETMQSARRAPNVDRILVPGEIEAETERRQRRDGIQYPRALLHRLDQTGVALGVGPLGEPEPTKSPE